MQYISKLVWGERFRKSMRPQAQYQTRSPPKNHKACHASTWNCVESDGQVIAYHKQECQSMATPKSMQYISKLERGEGFRKSTRPQAHYQTWSAPKNHNACQASTWNYVESNAPIEPHFWEMWITPTDVFDIYHMFTEDSFQRCNLPYAFKDSNSPPLKMQFAQDDQEDFTCL